MPRLPLYPFRHEGRSRTGLLDFDIQSGLHLGIAHLPNAAFANHATLTALEQKGRLDGSVAYFYVRPDLSMGTSRAGDALLRSNEHFVIPRAPSRPEELEKIWQGGDRIDENRM